jgi:hypothetical protein
LTERWWVGVRVVCSWQPKKNVPRGQVACVLTLVATFAIACFTVVGVGGDTP